MDGFCIQCGLDPCTIGTESGAVPATVSRAGLYGGPLFPATKRRSLSVLADGWEGPPMSRLVEQAPRQARRPARVGDADYLRELRSAAHFT